MQRRTIHKFELVMNDVQQVEMPTKSKILTVQTQKETPCIWAEVYPENEMETRSFVIGLTGQDLPVDLYDLRYIGTFQMSGGGFVGHLYEVI